MARPLRVEFPGAVYHVTGRGNARRPIYLSDSDRCCFLDILDRVVERYHWLCHSYCLMDNHYHVLFETPEESITTISFMASVDFLSGCFGENPDWDQFD